MDTRAQHLLLELYGCDPALLNDALFLAGLMRKAVSASGARVVGETFHAYSPHGVTRRSTFTPAARSTRSPRRARYSKACARAQLSCSRSHVGSPSRRAVPR
jgi:hypothetical protein